MTATLRSFTSSLRARIMLLVVLSTVPVFVLMLFNADELRHESANEASAEALRVSRLAADQQERVIEGTRHLLLALAPSGALRTSNTELCNALTARVLTESPSYANIGAVNVRGETFCSALPVTAPANVADRSWFRRALATGGLGVGEYQLEPATNRASINVGYPFRDADGAVRGVVFAALDLAWLSTAADGLDLTAGSVLTVTDRDGTVLMRYPNDDDWLGRRLPAGDLPPALFSGSGHGTAIVSPSGGAANLIGFATVNGLGEGVESVILSVPAAQAFAKVDDLLRRNLATLTLGAALVVALAWGFSEKLVLQRVKALAVAAGRLAAGELTTRTGLAHGSDELGNLARSFDEMADSLQTLHDDLEQRVHQRTMELEESNARLALVNRDLEEQISERKGAEAALDRQNAVLAAVMRSMNDGLVVTDNERTIQLWNGRASELWGVVSSNLIGENQSVVFPQIAEGLENPVPVRAAWVRALSHIDDRPSVDMTVLGPPRRDLEVHLFPVINADKANLGIGALIRDVTNERDLQRTKDELVSVVSHELRTPLASIVGFTELLITRDYSAERRFEFLSVMLREGQRLTQLINDFLDLQRMESGRQTVVLVLTPLRPLLERAVASAGDAAMHPIVLDAPEVFPPVLVDSDRVLQVLANLLSNARKYSPTGGEIRLTVRKIENAIEISVSDQGLGLPAEALPQLFQRFYRVDNSDRKTIGGTGLGLAICRQIIEVHGGKIWAESSGLGQGSRFCFTLPVVQPVYREGTVLIVEDDSAFGQLLETELSSAGLVTLRSTSAEVALAQIATVQPSVVVLDLILPGVQGEEFLPLLRGAGLVNTPIVVITMKDLDHDERRVLDHWGVVAVLRKGPGVAAEAVASVLQALAGGGAPGPR